MTQLFRLVSKSMNDTIADYRRRNEDYSRYIETWVHEVKTPIASCKLIIENPFRSVTRSLEEEIDRIDQYVEQALYYTRSAVVEKTMSFAAVRSIRSSVRLLKNNAKTFNFGSFPFSVKSLIKSFIPT